MKIIKPNTIADANFISSNVLENDYAVWNSATTYALNTFVIYVTGGYHNIYKSLQGTNLNRNPTVEIQGDPLLPPAWWLLISATNRWKAVDGRVDTQTINQDSIKLAYSMDGRVGGISFQNLDAVSIDIVAYNQTSYYKKTISLTSYGKQPSFNEYLYGLKKYQKKVYVDDLPQTSNLNIEISINKIGGIAKCGLMAFGAVSDFQIPSYGLTLEAVDYTTVLRNFDGTVNITKRGFSNVMDVSMWVPKDELAFVSQFLNGNNSTPMAYIGVNDYEITNIYGMHTTHRISIDMPTYSVLNFKIEGLI